MSDQISPVLRTKDKARVNYNRLSRWYDWLAGSEAKYRRIGVQALNLHSGAHVLEVGFGTGQCLLEFAKKVQPEGWVCGIDLSDGMAAVASKRIGEVNLADRIALSIGDALFAPFSDSSFDALFMSFTLELFDTPEIPWVLEQSWRILRPGGKLGVVTLVKTSQPGVAERVYEWFHAKMPATVDCRPIMAQQVVGAANFIIVEVISEKMWGLPVEIITAKKS